MKTLPEILDSDFGYAGIMSNSELDRQLIDILFRHRKSPVSKEKVYTQCEVCETKLDEEFYSSLDHEMQILIDRQEPILTAIKALIDKQVKEAQEAIAKELMGCLPEKRERKEVADDYDSVNWCGTCDQIYNMDGKCWCKPYNQALDEVRARLTAFIGKDSNENS